MRNFKILISSSEIGAGTRGSSQGPQAIRINAIEEQFSLFEDNEVEEIPVLPLQMHHGKQSSQEYIEEFVPLYEQLCDRLSHSLLENDKVLLMSGDHSNAGGWFSAIRETYPDKNAGLIWIDAHGDIHSPYTSPSGNVHGMPLAVLLADDNKENKIRDLDEKTEAVWNKMKMTGSKGIVPKFNPEDIVMIDIRDLEAEEWKSVKRLGIKYFTPEDRKTKGIEHIIEQTKEYLKDCDIIAITFDVDSMDAELVPGTGTPVSGGLTVDDAHQLLQAFWKMPQTMVLEFTEINPLLDVKNTVAKTSVKLLKKLFEDFSD